MRSPGVAWLAPRLDERDNWEQALPAFCRWLLLLLASFVLAVDGLGQAGEAAEDQRQHVQFDAFFASVMFHEVAHGLGIKQTINGKGKVREALKNLDLVEVLFARFHGQQAEQGCMAKAGRFGGTTPA